jgi:hypothetical protein
LNLRGAAQEQAAQRLDHSIVIATRGSRCGAGTLSEDTIVQKLSRPSRTR